MNDYFTSLIRTYVPLIIGAVISWLALHGVNPSLTDPQYSIVVTTLTAVVTGLYYTVVRLFEHYVSPKFGWLLGLAKTPTYGSKLVSGMQANSPAPSGPTATTPPSGE